MTEIVERVTYLETKEKEHSKDISEIKKINHEILEKIDKNGEKLHKISIDFAKKSGEILCKINESHCNISLKVQETVKNSSEEITTLKIGMKIWTWIISVVVMGLLGLSFFIIKKVFLIQ
jgi:hypothetical protein